MSESPTLFNDKSSYKYSNVYSGLKALSIISIGIIALWTYFIFDKFGNYLYALLFSIFALIGLFVVMRIEFKALKNGEYFVDNASTYYARDTKSGKNKTESKVGAVLMVVFFFIIGYVLSQGN